MEKSISGDSTDMMFEGCVQMCASGEAEVMCDSGLGFGTDDDHMFLSCLCAFFFVNGLFIMYLAFFVWCLFNES